MDINGLTESVRAFADERDWQQFHTPRNLLLALVGEVGELAAEFQWLGDGDSWASPVTTAVREEIADVAIYLLRLADVLGIDLADAISEKLIINSERYPVEATRGSTTKYTEL